jgi:hypothetical protein
MHHARKSAALLGKPSRSARDPDAKFLVLQGFVGQIERRRIAEPYHLPITADQFRSQLRGRKRQQNFPLPHERPAFELIGLSRVDGLRPIDQRRVTPDPPHYQPMDLSFAVLPISDSLTLVLMSGRPSPIVTIGCPDGGWKLFHLLGLRANYK